MSTSTTASAFLETLGVNTHIGAPAYANTATVLSDLQYIGFTNVREWVPPAGNPGAYGTLAAAGIDFDFTLPEPDINIPAYIANLNSFEQQFPGHIKYTEGPNEIFNTPITYNGQTGMAAGDAVMQALYAAVHGDAELAGIPVVNLTTGGGTQAETFNLLGNMQASVDLGNDHTYPMGSDPTPYDYLSMDIPWQTSVTTPALPTVVTEAGYYTMPDGSYGVNVDIQAHYTVDMVLDARLLGVPSIYIYELIDDTSDPGNTNLEDHLGLFNSDGTPKPAATDLHNLTTILADPGDTAATRTGLNYTVSGLPSDGHSLQLVKASGVVDVIVWAEPNIWNNATDVETAAPVSNITVSLGGVYQSISIYDPMTGTTPIATYSNTGSVQLSLGNDPLIIQVGGPATVASNPPSPNDTVVKAGSAAAITDASGNTWTITSGAQVAVNGVTDAATSKVAELAYVNGTIWQETTAGLWSGETKPNDSWSTATTVSPLPVSTTSPPASPNDTVVLAGSTAAIIDASGNAWTITSGAQIAVNGVTDALTSQVTELAYVNGTIWQENTSNLWYGETKPNDSWSAGTTVSPLPTVSPPPTVITVPASEASVSVAVISSTINATSGNHTFLISGHADTFNLSGGVETITDSGSGGNTFKLPAAGSGSAIFNAAVLSDGDVFNLAAALSGTSWTGSSSTLGSYLHTLQSGANTELLVSAKATRHGTGTLLATFDNEKLSLSTILSHSVT